MCQPTLWSFSRWSQRSSRSFRRWSSRASVYSGDLFGMKKDDDAILVVPDAADAAAGASAEADAAPMKSTREEEGSIQGQFSVSLSLRFVAGAVLLSAASAFSAGCVARMLLLSKFGALASTSPCDVAASQTPSKKPHQLPAPTVLPGKDVPYTTYTSKSFRAEGSATSQTLHIDRRGATTTANQVTSAANDDLKVFTAPTSSSVGYMDSECASCEDGCADEASAGNASFDSIESLVLFGQEEAVAPVNDYSHNDDSDGLHLPAGQHLFVDIKDVDSGFLNSEERLATAMVELISGSGLTLLSYHCHSLVPIGVSCVGVLLESHVAFHTWPKEGVITMDLFTCGGNPLIPVLSSVLSLFGIPRLPSEGESQRDMPDPTMLWAHKLRGFREGFAPGYDRERNPFEQFDLGHTLGRLDYDLKTQLVSTKTAFQTVDVYDLMDPQKRSAESYQRSLSGDSSFEATHPEQFGPDRALFLDGVIQSTLYGDAPYHESIVHPAMITHPNPRRVAIIGGGEGATLREVLKHKTVEEAAMIEIDEGVVELSREHLPQWQDCSSISHHDRAAEWCFDDERVNAKFEDAMAYFVDHFANDEEWEEEAYDIIIMDALDPNDDIEFAVELYTSDTYLRSLYKALTADGILVVQVGQASEPGDPADEMGMFANRSVMREKLEELGFESIHLYEEAHSGFGAPWTTMLALKDGRMSENWHRNAADIDLQLHKRILATKSGGSSLRYFDGATMISYQLPTRAFEDVHCRQQNPPEDCDKISSSETFPIKSNETAAYNPVIERHGRTSRHSIYLPEIMTGKKIS